MYWPLDCEQVTESAGEGVQHTASGRKLMTQDLSWHKSSQRLIKGMGKTEVVPGGETLGVSFRREKST